VSIFRLRIGECDWCKTPDITLVDYSNMKVCKGCLAELRDHNSDHISKTEEGYQELLDLFNRTK